MKFYLWTDKALKLNTVSGISFILSSASLLVIPVIDKDDTVSVLRMLIPGLFWAGLIVGIILQVISSVIMSKPRIKKRLGKLLLIPVAFFICFVMLLALVLLVFKENLMVLCIDLFCIIISLESFFVIRRGVQSEK